MENLEPAETPSNRLTLTAFEVETLSDLTGLDAGTIAAKWDTPRQFTLSEVDALAPHLGMTADEFVTAVLA